MKKKIDYENWDRKEIYELFHGYLFYLTVEIDITEFLETIHKHQWKFYPSICYCITKTVNLDERYRYAKVDGQVCVWDHVNTHYTLMRKNTDHLFTHQRTGYQEDFQKFYEAFLKDKKEAENCSSLYAYQQKAMDDVHISTMPNTVYTSLSYAKPNSFTKYGTDKVSYIPFVMIGKYHEENGRMKMPVTVEFHHAVNDGWHAENFFRLLEECCRGFQQEKEDEMHD